MHGARPPEPERKATLDASPSAIWSHFEVEQFPEVDFDRSENKHQHDATAANPFAFTNQDTVNLRNLILRAIASNYGNGLQRRNFMPILLACLELRTDWRRAA
jgi:hypothetical protein